MPGGERAYYDGSAACNYLLLLVSTASGEGPPLARAGNVMLKWLNYILGNRISDHYFYKWIRTKNEKYLHRYLDLTS